MPGAGPDPLLAALIGLDTGVAKWDPPIEPLPDASWDRLLQDVESERVVGLLGAAVDAGWPVTDAQAEQLSERRRIRNAGALRLEAGLLRVGRILDDAGVPFVVLKGLATARLLYPDVSWRQSGDVDLYVDPLHFDRAADLISESGGVDRAAPTFGPAWASRAKSTTLTLPLGVEVDLHRRIQGLVRAQTVPPSLLAPGYEFTLSGHRFSGLPPAGMFVQAALHLTARNTQLSTLADLVRLHLAGLRFDDAVLAEMTPITAATIQWALDEARRWVELPEADWEPIVALRVTPVARRLQRYLQAHPTSAPIVEAASTGPRTGFALCRELVLPTQEFLEFKGRTRPQQIGHLLGTVPRALRPRRPGLRTE